METTIQVWQQRRVGELYLAEFSALDVMIGAAGPFHARDLAQALQDGIESDADLVAGLTANDGEYDLVTPHMLDNRGEEHAALALAVRTHEWVVAAQIVARHCVTAVVDEHGADVLQDWLSHGDWSDIGTPAAVAAAWDAAGGM